MAHDWLGALKIIRQWWTLILLGTYPPTTIIIEHSIGNFTENDGNVHICCDFEPLPLILTLPKSYVLALRRWMLIIIVQVRKTRVGKTVGIWVWYHISTWYPLEGAWICFTQQTTSGAQWPIGFRELNINFTNFISLAPRYASTSLMVCWWFRVFSFQIAPVKKMRPLKAANAGWRAVGD